LLLNGFRQINCAGPDDLWLASKRVRRSYWLPAKWKWAHGGKIFLRIGYQKVESKSKSKSEFIMKTRVNICLVWIGLLLGVGRIAAQNTLLTYQGEVMDNGSNFTGTGLFQFALISSTNFNLQATATAILSGGFVTSYTITSGGSGYVSAPTVTVSGGGGSGATAVASISAGVVTNIAAVNAGSGYTSAPSVTISPPPPNLALTSLWSNDGTSREGSEPAAFVSVPVTNGLFTVVLGDTALVNMTAISASFFTEPNLQLRIWFNDGVNGAAELNPIQNLTPAPYAVGALMASNLSGMLPATQLSGVVSNVQLADNTITINAGTGLAGGGTVALGNSITLSNTGLVTITGSLDFAISTNGGTVMLGTTATNADTPDAIVKRDASGNFSAGTITLAGSLSMLNAGENTVVGSGALGKNTNGTDNTACGWDALYSNTSGSNNIASGWEALYANTSGTENTASGYFALFSNTTNGQNTATGAYALYYNNGGGGNTAGGWGALFNNTSGSNNTAHGDSALFDNTSGAYNSASGVSALYYNMTGSSNTAGGSHALYDNMSGSANTATGVGALSGNDTGNNNTADGCGAMSGLTAGNNNIAVGCGAGTNLSEGSYNIDIGSPGGTGDNNIIRIGSGQLSTFIAGITGQPVTGAPVYVSPAGQLGIQSSSERFKQDIHSMGQASDSILALRPVAFHYKAELDARQTAQFGLIAEEVNKVNPDLVMRDDKNQIYGVRYDAVNAMLLNEFLKEHRKVQEQQEELEGLKEKVVEVEALEKRLKALEQLLLPRSEGNSIRSAKLE
jgi:trimeric autotransporter adhesin